MDASEPPIWSAKWADNGDKNELLADPKHPGQLLLRDQTDAACGFLLACAAARAVDETTVRVTMLRDEKLIAYLKKEMTKVSHLGSESLIHSNRSDENRTNANCHNKQTKQATLPWHYFMHSSNVCFS